MSRLFLVRHARTASNVAQTLGAGHDDPLDPVGERQARAVAAHFAALGLSAPRVYASPYRRARQTAEAIADALGVPVTVLDGVREIHTGTWAGRPYSHLHTHVHEWRHEDGTPGFPGGESLRAVARRFRTALEGVFEGEGTPVVVSHGAALSAVLALLLKADPEEAWREGRFTHGNTAVTELLSERGEWRARRLADAAHLAPVPGEGT
ncbi:histidine phosphatase family protein [Deinococcus aluminii]|uniref:Phosphoserine phosphatase 2 n=1 Tax=Deinococcus aluminii TaxID=1656885 RepID=A0ABP9XB10_9DEIO